MKHSMHSAGTTLGEKTPPSDHAVSANATAEGSWDDVTRFIGQAHSLLHGSGVVRIHTHISIGSRTDKKQGFQDKVDSVNAILQGMSREDVGAQESDDALGEDTDGPSMHDVESSMAEANDPNIQPGLEQHRILSHGMHSPMANMGHAIHQQLQMAGHPMHQQQHQMSPGNHQMRPGHPQMSPHQHAMSQSPHPLSQSMNMQQ